MSDWLVRAWRNGADNFSWSCSCGAEGDRSLRWTEHLNAHPTHGALDDVTRAVSSVPRGDVYVAAPPPRLTPAAAVQQLVAGIEAGLFEGHEDELINALLSKIVEQVP